MTEWRRVLTLNRIRSVLLATAQPSVTDVNCESKTMLRTAGILGIFLLAWSPVRGQNRAAATPSDSGAGVPAEYSGKWVCQSAVPGYNLPFPVASGPTPSTQRMSTPPSTVVITFTLNTDGTYQAPNARGHYSFHATDKTIDWLDGLHREQFSKTELSRRSNGAPSLSLHANQRYYGCFLAKESNAPEPKPNESVAKETKPVAPAGGQRYTKEEFLARGREGAKAYQRGDLTTARAIFEDLVNADPNSADAHASLGALLTQTKENDAALAHLDRAIELNPRELSAYVNRGEVYLRLGRRQEGEADLKKAISLDPTGKNPAANRARALLHGKISY